MNIFEILKVKRTELLGNAKDTIQAFFESPKKSAEDEWVDQNPVDESEAIDWWQQYGFVSRPPEGTESLAFRFGQQVFGIASRFVAAAKIYGKLAEGDVALYSTGNNSIRLNNSGSVSIVCKDGSKQIVFTISPKTHSIQAVTAGGLAFEMSDERGITLNAGTKMLTLASAQCVQIIGPSAVIQSGVVKLGMQASKPLVGVAALIPGAPNVFI